MSAEPQGWIANIRFTVPAGRARSDCAYEQVVKLGPVSRTAGMDCEYPIDLMRACCNEWKYMDSVMKGSKDWK